MRSRNTLLGLFITALGGALLALAYLAAPSDLGSGTVQASNSAEDEGFSDSATMGSGEDSESGAHGAGAGGEGGRTEVVGEAAPLESGAFAATALYGRVVDPDGEGVPKALVYLYPELDGWGEPDALQEERTTDAAGRFRFRDLEEHTPYVLFATADGFRPTRTTWSCGRDGDIELEPALSITGRVLDAKTSETLAGVDLAIEVPWIEDDELRDKIRTTSDEEGRYRLGPVRTEGLQRLFARRPGYQEERVEMQILPGRTDGYDVRLGSGPMVVLEFYDLTTGDLLADTDITLERAGERTTDAEGRIEVSLQAVRARGGSSIRLVAEIDGWCETRATLPADEEGFPDFARIPLCRGGVVRGTVTAGEVAIEEARVDFYSARQNRRRPTPRGANAGPDLPPGIGLNDGERRTLTAADGTFELRGIVPRGTPVAVRADHADYPEVRREDIDPPAVGEETVVELELPTGSEVRGTVRVNGEPTAAELFWWGEGGGGRSFSNDEGTYRMRGIGTGEIKISVQTERGSWGGGREEQDTVWVEPNTIVEHDIERFSAKSIIAGLVRDAGGNPQAGLEVTTWAERQERGGGVGTNTTTGADGTFELEVEPLPGAPYMVFVRDGARRSSERDVAAGTTGLELVLPELGRLGLRVVDEANREPLQRYQVHWRSARENNYELLRLSGRQVSPGPDGIFVADLPLGPVDLLVGSPTQGFATVEIEGQTVDRRDPPGVVDVVLPRGTKVELTFVPADGSAGGRPPRVLQRGRVVLAAPGEIPAAGGGADRTTVATLTLRGRAIRAYRSAVTLEAVEPGRYRFEGLPDDLALEPPEIDVPARDKATFEIRWRTIEDK